MPLQSFPFRRLIVAAALAAAVLPATARTDEQPFEATIDLHETLAFTGALPCMFIGSLNGTGVASYLGQVSAAAQDCVNPVPTASGAPAFSFASTAPGAVFTTASGEKLYATYGGLLLPRTGAPHAVKGIFTITGGTGEYAGATGDGTITGVEEINMAMQTGSGRVSFTGTIRLRRAGR